MNTVNEILSQLNILESLPGVSLTIEMSANPNQSDALLRLETQVGHQSYAVHLKQTVTTTTLPPLLSTLNRLKVQHERPILLVSAYLTPGVTERLLAEHIEFVDEAGNLFIDSPAAYALILGQKPARTATSTGLTATDLEVIFALLVHHELRAATYREVSAATGVSLGKLSTLFKQLKDVGHLTTFQSGKRILTNLVRLLERWEFGYLEQLRPKLMPTHLRLRKNMTLADVKAQASSLPGVLLGGEYAADRFTHYLKPGTLTLHVPRGKIKTVTVDLRLAPAEDEADVVLLERFLPPSEADALDEYKLSGKSSLAHPILVRAELLALDNNRVREVADRLLDQTILPELTSDV